MPIKYKTFTVKGNGHFPTDMLRYDNCWPSDPESAIAICPQPFGDEEKKRFFHNPREVTLTTCSPNGPTKGRWSSFMWSVIR